ncbi:MAG: hypothetical protein AAB576_09160, partial [Elusimicrobiota bacterium]
ALAREGRWERMDGLVDAFTGRGIKLILVVGVGYRKEAVRYRSADGSLLEASPDRIGRERYLALMRWLVGAGVRRYAGRVEFWQVENEINIARLVTRVGWRVKEKSWGDREFLRSLISTLCRTVHAEGERAGRELKTTHNFSADMAWKDWLGPKIPASLSADIRAFSAPDDLDIIGVDLYANHFTGWPMFDKKVARDVAGAVSAAGGRPVWVLETGYATGPKWRGFSEGRQEDYFRKAFDAAYGAGADLVLAFGWFWNPHGWYTDNPAPLPWWHPMSPEQHWSPVHVERGADGSRNVRLGPAYDELTQAARRWVAGTPP